MPIELVVIFINYAFLTVIYLLGCNQCEYPLITHVSQCCPQLTHVT